MYLIKDKKPIHIFVEKEAYEGVYRIAQKVALDFERVCDHRPQIIRETGDLKTRQKETAVLFATIGKSPILEQLILAGKLDVSTIQGKWECFLRTVVENPIPGVEEMVIICGSDKRGTIYGMFSLSEYIGVSPLWFWGDVEPLKQENVEAGPDWEMVSKEPSVRFRGFFINDEWPCFGQWTREKFGDVNAKAYEVIFEFLLRMKGNYLWPAMWCSNFPLDGPDSLNEELADIYGVVIGFSHHEPCLRSGGEFALVKGENSPYGNDWSFHRNREGIIRFWRDGLLRSGKYENLITIGMRGENDSTILGDDSGLKENIDLLKDVITVQKQLIKECVGEEKASGKQLLAIYKEVEPFFYGDETVPGLKDWDGLENVICMLCEDNYGFLRSLPSKELYEEITKKGGGFGMYYHLDYHGAPISYEWIPSTPMPKIWDQMCMAYDYGVQDVWIVNVGDVKGNELELEYFLTLAYDFETWGSKNPNGWKDYLSKKLKSIFPELSETLLEEIAQVYKSFMEINALRRPEALNEKVFHPCNYLEADRLLEIIEACDTVAEQVYEKLKQMQNQRALQAYYSLFYYHEKAGMNLYKMWIYSGKNHHYAKQGRVIANTYAEAVRECLKIDKALGKAFAEFREGKWKGMELEAHIGFCTWNEDGARYPVYQMVEPYEEPRLSLSRKDDEKTVVRSFGNARSILVDDFMEPGIEAVTIELANTGVGKVEFEILGDAPWLEVSAVRGSFDLIREILLVYHPERMGEELTVDQVTLIVRSTQSSLIVEHKADVEIIVTAKKPIKKAEGVIYPKKGIIAINAIDYISKQDREGAAYVQLDGYGRSGFGMKVLPNTSCFSAKDRAPALKYQFAVEKPGEYEMEMWLTPTSPVVYKGHQRLAIQVNDGEKQEIHIIPDTYRAGDWRDPIWSLGVMDHIRKIHTEIRCRESINQLTIYAMDPGVVLEKIFIYHKDNKPKDSYLGM